MKRFFALLLVFCFVTSLVSCSKTQTESDRSLKICDKDGNVVATLKKMDFSDKDLSDPSYSAYVKIALKEAHSIIKDIYDCDDKKAEKLLFKKAFTVSTYMDPVAISAAEEVALECEKRDIPFDCAIQTLSGEVCAVFGEVEGGQMRTHSPFSTIKPLSVYAPAMEKNLIDWGTMFPDKPYKQILEDDGRIVDWPTNAATAFTYQDTLLSDCIKQSLNTTAVHCLMLHGVKNSVEFLSDSFDMNLRYEQNKIAVQGEEEIIGNIAMGYLSKGFSPIDLSGYYQIFGRLGNYTVPKTVQKITSSDKKTVYENKSESKQVIRKETAYLMNRLLSQVVSPGGTGEMAALEGTELVGKTGTGNNEGGNWFVGVTPEYSCAVWHGANEDRENFAAELFRKVMEKMPDPQVKEFEASSQVKKTVFCSKTGDLISSSCNYMHIGYYALSHKPGACAGHSIIN